MSESAVKLLYIAGSNRSGSTLLGRILGQIPGFVFVGELRHLWERGLIHNQLCGCGTPIKTCPFWQEVFHEAFGGFKYFNGEYAVQLQHQVDRVRFAPFILSPVKLRKYQKSFSLYSKIMRDLYLAILKVSNSKIVVDSSKVPSSILSLNSTQWADLYTVHLVRDSRGVAFSNTKRKRRLEIVNKKAYMDVLKPSKSARAWLRENMLIEIFRYFTNEYMRIRYEDLVARPSQQLGYILERLQCPIQHLDFIKEKAVFIDKQHTVSGNPGRFLNGEIELKVDNTWRTDFNTLDKIVVSIITAPLLLRYY